MSDVEICTIWRMIRRLQWRPDNRVARAMIEGSIKRLEDHGVTEQDIDRLGLA